MFGEHVIKHWSSTQTLILLSSGEAEYYGCVRAGSHGLGIKSMLADLGVKEKRLRIKTDASVAKSLASRRPGAWEASDTSKLINCGYRKKSTMARLR